MEDTKKLDGLSTLFLFIICFCFVVYCFEFFIKIQVLEASFLNKHLFEALAKIMMAKTKMGVQFSVIFIVACLGMGYAYNSKSVDNDKKYILIYLIGNMICAPLFIYIDSYGFTNYYIYVFLFPIVLISTIYFSYNLLRHLRSSKLETDENGLNSIYTNKETLKNFVIPTKLGKLAIDKPTYGIAVEGSAGGGKSVLGYQFIQQAIFKGNAGVIYDYEGDPHEEDGAILTRYAYKSLQMANRKRKKQKNILWSLFNPTNTIGSPIKFAALNFTDLERTVRCNPCSYVTTKNEIKEMVHNLMKNLEREWSKKTDFWASNAINYMEGCALYLYNNFPKYFTIPHLVQLILSDFAHVLDVLSSDQEVQQLMLPVMTAYEQQAEGQVAGVVSSTQLPVTKINTAEIAWVLSPSKNEAFDLDITNKNNPVMLCIGNSPKLVDSLSPVISVIMAICAKNMNQLGKQDSIYMIDEMPTVFISRIDKLPAEARKKGIKSIFLYQTFKQMERDYGKEAAEIVRDNCSNQFYFKTNNFDTAKRVSELYGEYRKTEKSITTQSSGSSSSTSTSVKREKILFPSDIRDQEPGHCTGFLATGKPNKFHVQFDYFELDTPMHPKFAKRFDTGDSFKDTKLMNDLVQANFFKVKNDVRDILDGTITPAMAR